MPLLLGLLTALVALSVSAVSVALPDLARDLHSSPAGVSWVMSGFALAVAVGTAVFGRLVDLWPMRRTAVIAVVLLGVGAAVAGATSQLPVIIAGRVAAGFGGGGVTVVALALLTARYEGPARTRAIALLVGVVTVLSGCGTLIGGLLVHAGTWRAPVALPALALLGVVPVLRLAPLGPAAGGRWDGRGALLVVVAAVAVLTLLQIPGTGPPAWLPAAAAVLGVAAGARLVVHVRRRPEGFLPAAVIGDRRFLWTALAAAGLQGGYFAMILAAPPRLGAADDPVRVGLLLLPAAVFATAVDLGAGRLAARGGRRRIAAVLALASTVGLLLHAGLDTAVTAVTAFGLALAGFSAGQSLLNDAALDTLAPARRGIGVGVFNLLLNLGGAVAAAAYGSLSTLVGPRPTVACLAVLPALSAVAALIARSDRGRRRRTAVAPP